MKGLTIWGFLAFVVLIIFMCAIAYYAKPNPEKALEFFQPKPERQYLQEIRETADAKADKITEVKETTTTLDLCQIVYKTYGKFPKSYTSDKGYCYYNNEINIPFCIDKKC